MMSANVIPQPVYLHNYLHLVGVVVLYYDYFLTFRDEYWRIWHKPKTVSAGLFFLNRYLPFFGDIAVNVGNFYIFPTEAASKASTTYLVSFGLTAGYGQGCRHYAFFRQVLLIVNQVVVCLILFLRTFALYGRDWRVGGSILAFAAVLFGVSCWSVVGQHEDIELRGGCHLASDRMTAVRIAVSWESLFLFDLTIFSLTLYKTYRERRRNHVTSGRRDIVSLVMRDGALYFAVMASLNFANTLTFYFLEPLLRGCLSTAASSISVTMMSRLMLNLHASATGAGHNPITTTRTDLSDPSENSTSLLFTSRISMPPVTALWDRGSRFRESAYVRDARSGHDRGYIDEVYELADMHYHDPEREAAIPLHVSIEDSVGKPA